MKTDADTDAHLCLPACVFLSHSISNSNTHAHQTTHWLHPRVLLDQKREEYERLQADVNVKAQVWNVCVCACVCVRVCACVCACVRACVRVCVVKKTASRKWW